jgi:integrase
MPKLTKRIIDSADIKAKPYFIWCSELPGFGVRVFPSAKRIYYADYRNKSGIRKRMSLGHHGKLTTEEARKLAIVTLGGVIKGEDPALDRVTRRKSLTVTNLCASYLAAAERGLVMGKRNLPKKQTTLYIDRGRIEHHIKPLLGEKLVRDLVQSDINRFVRDVTVGKTALVVKTEKKRGKAVVEGGAGTAARTAGLLGGILSFAVSEGIIAFNPARGVKRQADASRTRRLTPDEYGRLGAALRAARDEGEPEQGLNGVWLLALTGCRLGEIQRLKWSEVEVADRCFRLEDGKEGASIRPIGKAAFNIIAKIQRTTSCAYLLPSVRSDGSSYGGMARAMERITTRSGLEGVTAHTFRHSYASVAGDLGFSDSTIAGLLGHAAGTITSRYVHRLDQLLIAAANKVAGEIHRQMASGADGRWGKLSPGA